MKTVAQLLKHDFSEGDFKIYNKSGNETYRENLNGDWHKSEFDKNFNKTYYEDSNDFWQKAEFDDNNNRTYFENSNGYKKGVSKNVLKLTIPEIEEKYGSKIEIVNNK